MLQQSPPPSSDRLLITPVTSAPMSSSSHISLSSSRTSPSVSRIAQGVSAPRTSGPSTPSAGKAASGHCRRMPSAAMLADSSSMRDLAAHAVRISLSSWGAQLQVSRSRPGGLRRVHRVVCGVRVGGELPAP